jgi:hypothetical protein
MVGMVSRWFLECLEGWKDTKALITFGTPYRGSLNAVDSLANGVRKGPFGLFDLTELARSFTSLHQLLPIYPCYDDGDGTSVRIGETDRVPNVDPARAAAGLAFHQALAAANEANLKDPAYLEGRYRIHPIVGTDQETSQFARRKGDGVELLAHEEGSERNWNGDGTVPRVSATPLELSGEGREMFVYAKHGSLQNTDAVLAHFDGLVTGLRLDQDKYRAVERALALDVEDVFFDDEPIAVRARIEGAVLDEGDLRGEVADGSGRSVKLEFDGFDDGWRIARLPAMAEGAYRVRVEGTGLPTVEDSFAVAKTRT